MTGRTIGVIIAIVVVLLVVLAISMARRRAAARRAHLQEAFGPEYNRTVDEEGRRRAEADLAAREKRHAQLDIRPLAPGRAGYYRERWTGLQAAFVDRPIPAVHDADTLVGELMAERGYPTGDFDQQVADLSVEHHGVLENYREAHRIGRASDQATTEELRQGMVHYRALFDELLVEAERNDAAAQSGSMAGSMPAPAAPTVGTTTGAPVTPQPVAIPEERATLAQDDAAMRARDDSAMRGRDDASMRGQDDASMRGQDDASMRGRDDAAMRDARFDEAAASGDTAGATALSSDQLREARRATADENVVDVRGPLTAAEERGPGHHRSA